MRKTFILFLFINIPLLLFSQTNYDFITIFEKSNGTETATYDQTIQYFEELMKLLNFYFGVILYAYNIYTSKVLT